VKRPILYLVLSVFGLVATLPDVSCARSVGTRPSVRRVSPHVRDGHVLRVRIFDDPSRPNADRVAHGVGVLIAGGESAIVPSFLREVVAETSCGTKLFTAPVARGSTDLAMLGRHRTRLVNRLRADSSVTNIGNALVDLSVPFKIQSSSRDDVVDAGWVAVVVGLTCPKTHPPPTGPPDPG